MEKTHKATSRQPLDDKASEGASIFRGLVGLGHCRSQDPSFFYVCSSSDVLHDVERIPWKKAVRVWLELRVHVRFRGVVHSQANLSLGDRTGSAALPLSPAAARRLQVQPRHKNCISMAQSSASSCFCPRAGSYSCSCRCTHVATVSAVEGRRSGQKAPSGPSRPLCGFPCLIWCLQRAFVQLKTQCTTCCGFPAAWHSPVGSRCGTSGCLRGSTKSIPPPGTSCSVGRQRAPQVMYGERCSQQALCCRSPAGSCEECPGQAAHHRCNAAARV